MFTNILTIGENPRGSDQEKRRQNGNKYVGDENGGEIQCVVVSMEVSGSRDMEIVPR